MWGVGEMGGLAREGGIVSGGWVVSGGVEAVEQAGGWRGGPRPEACLWQGLRLGPARGRA